MGKKEAEGPPQEDGGIKCLSTELLRPVGFIKSKKEVGRDYGGATMMDIHQMVFITGLHFYIRLDSPQSIGSKK